MLRLCPYTLVRDGWTAYRFCSIRCRDEYLDARAHDRQFARDHVKMIDDRPTHRPCDRGGLCSRRHG